MTEEQKDTGLATVEEDKIVPMDDESVDFATDRKRVMELKHDAEEAYWVLGEALFDVYDGAKYQAWGYRNFKSYVHHELDFKDRKAEYLVKLHRWFLTIPEDVRDWVRAMGWTKARMLVDVVTAENSEEWRAKVEGKTVAEIEAILKGREAGDDDGEKGSGDGGVGDGSGSDDGSSVGEQAEKWSAYLYPDQRKTVERAIKKAKELAETDKDGHAMEMICTDFLATNNGYKTMTEYLESVEAYVGYKIVAYDLDKDIIAYGQETIDAINE